MQKERTLSDAELLKGGAEYVINDEGLFRLELKENQINEIKNKNFIEIEIPKIINSLPDTVQEELAKAKLLNVKNDGNKYAIQYTNIESSSGSTYIEGQARYIITNNNTFKIPYAFGHQYLDINPSNGLPVARFSYLGKEHLEQLQLHEYETIDSSYRGFFDGERLMSLDRDDAKKYDKEESKEKILPFTTCAYTTNFFSGGYRIDVVPYNQENNQTIINGYLYRNFTDEFDAVLEEKYEYKDIRNIGDMKERSRIASEILQEIKFEEEGVLLFNKKEIKPIGYFKEAEKELDKNGFTILKKSEFVKL